MDHDLELISPILEILEIWVCNILQNPGNIGNLSFSIFLDAWKYWKSDFSVFWDAWKYWKSESATFSRILEILPKPRTQSQTQPISLLGPGTGNSGYCGRTRTGYCGRTRTRAAGASRNPNPLGGLRPPRPPVGFFRDGRGPASYFLASYFIIPHPASYFINVLFY